MISQLELTARLYQLMCARYPRGFASRVFRLREKQIDVVAAQGKVLTYYTDHIYNQYLQKPQYVEELLTQTVALWKELLPQAEIPVEALLPVIKNKQWLEDAYRVQLACQDTQTIEPKRLQAQQILTLPLVSDLFIVFGLDLSGGMQFLVQDDLLSYDAVGNLEGLYHLALQNLSSLLPQLHIEETLAGSALHVDSYHEASMILLYDQWKEKLAFEGAPAVALVARDAVWLADCAYPQQVNAMRQFAQGVYPTLAYNLSTEIFVFNNGQLELYPDK